MYITFYTLKTKTHLNIGNILCKLLTAPLPFTKFTKPVIFKNITDNPHKLTFKL